MKATNYLLPTLKENPTDAVVDSHKLMIRGGFIRKSFSGLYFYLPLGKRVLNKIERIIREEMDKSGALEFELPILTPADYWKTSGRWDKMGKEMVRLKDRHDVEYSLGPTHEESFCFLMSSILKSYKDLPINVYQIHTKFRDEIRPRFGVIRSREFTMKDAYSFHLDENSLNTTYEIMRKTYRSIFSRCGLKTIPVEADSGSMGGAMSEEFMVPSSIGEETLLFCNHCGYKGNNEKTPRNQFIKNPNKLLDTAKEVLTENKKSISEITEYFSIKPDETIKSVALFSSEKKLILFLEGDKEVNLHKITNFFHDEFLPINENELIKDGIVPGFIGPTVSASNYEIYFDNSIQMNKTYVVGANKKDVHIQNYVFTEDKINQIKFLDFSLVVANDPCPKCQNPLNETKGIEVGHIFKLGNKYSNDFHITVLDQNGKEKIVTMGCYGIGVNRTMATAIEQFNDENGIKWPISISPFEILILSITKNPQDLEFVESVYSRMIQSNLDVLWDDRNLGAGFKFKDAELIGFPIRVTFGKEFFEKKEISIWNRKEDKETKFVFTTIENLIEEVLKIRNELYSQLGQNE